MNNSQVDIFKLKRLFNTCNYSIQNLVILYNLLYNVLSNENDEGVKMTMLDSSYIYKVMIGPKIIT